MPTPPNFGLFEGQDAGLLAGNVQAGLFAEAEHFGIVADAVEAQPGAEDIEVLIVGAGQRLRQVKSDVAAGVDRSVLADYAFGQSGERRHQLDGGTRNESRLEGQPLVHHTENAPVGRVHRDHTAREGPQGSHGGAADDQIVAIDVIAQCRVDAGNFGFVGKLLGSSVGLFLLRAE